MHALTTARATCNPCPRRRFLRNLLLAVATPAPTPAVSSSGKSYVGRLYSCTSVDAAQATFLTNPFRMSAGYASPFSTFFGITKGTSGSMSYTALCGRYSTPRHRPTTSTALGYRVYSSHQGTYTIILRCGCIRATPGKSPCYFALCLYPDPERKKQLYVRCWSSSSRNCYSAAKPTQLTSTNMYQALIQANQHYIFLCF